MILLTLYHSFFLSFLPQVPQSSSTVTNKLIVGLWRGLGGGERRKEKDSVNNIEIHRTCVGR
jgi:hypothetical protein